MGLLSRLTGSGGSDVETSNKDCPIPDGIISAVEAEHEEELADTPHSLREVADAVQRYIWSTEYTNRPGNAFFEQLAHQFNEPDSLRRPLRVEGNVLFANVLAEGWADITANTSIDGKRGLTEAEAVAVRDAHARFGEEHGLSGYSHNTNLIAIKFRNETRLSEFIKLVGLSDDQVNRPTDDE